MRAGFWMLLAIPMAVGCGGCLEDLERSGVRIHNQIDPKSHAQITANGLLSPGETAVAYFDTTVTMNASECYLLTNRNLKHFKQGTITSMALSEITSVTQEDAGIEGDRIIASGGGKKMILTIPHLNDGHLFLAELQERVGPK